MAAFAVLGLVAGGAVAAEPKLLPPEQAFRFSGRTVDDRTIEARFRIADGYYLYRDKLKFAAAPGSTGLSDPSLPSGKVKEDQFFGKVETYRGDLIVRLSLASMQPGQAITVTAESQGCADLGVCYPPTQQKVTLVVPLSGKGPGAVIEANPAKKNWFN